MKHYLLTALLATISFSTLAADTQSVNSTETSSTQTAAITPSKPFGLASITPEQEQHIKEIQNDLKTQLQAQTPTPEIMEEKINQLRALIEAESFDEAKMKQLLQQQSNQQLDLQVMKLKAEHDMYQVLTPEQKKTLEERREIKKQQMKMMMKKAQ